MDAWSVSIRQCPFVHFVLLKSFSTFRIEISENFFVLLFNLVILYMPSLLRLLFWKKKNCINLNTNLQNILFVVAYIELDDIAL